MPKDAIEPGRVLAGRYRLEALLGEGGFGTVWTAHHLVLEAPVAVKLIDPEIAEDEVAVERFLREAKAAASLRSPHVVQILDYGVDDGQPFIAMELLEGETLARRIKRLGRLEAAEALRILGHVARAIGRAHDAGVVHRDLKPENVFLIRNDDEEVAKVLDFGVAKLDATKLGFQSTATRTGSLLGTPFYMSPEQVLGNKEVDFRSDLWSLGVIAFEMITGRRPFVSDGLGDLVLQITVHPLPVPSQFAPVPSGFDAWFLRVMAREPSARLASAREVVETLREALDLGAESADTVVTVPEPGEELPAALKARRPYATDPPPSPARRRDASTAPTIRLSEAAAGGLGAAASPDAGPTVPDVPRGEPPARARGDAATVSPFSAPAESPRRRRGWGLGLGVAAGATAIGLLGGLAAYHLREQNRPLPEVAPPEVHAAAPSDVGPQHAEVTTAPTEPSAEPSASPSAGVEPAVEPSAAPSAGPSSAATPPSAKSGDEPPPEWLPKEVNGQIVKPDWARPEPEAPPPPPPPEDRSPYD